MNAPQPNYLERAQARRDLAEAGLLPGGAETERIGAWSARWRRNTEAIRRLDDAEGDLLSAGGMHVVSIKGGDEEGGVTSHRGALHPDEYVNEDDLRPMVEAELGFAYEQVRSVYRQGRLSDTQRELRGRIDARLLALSRSGANLSLLGRLLGFKVESDSHCEPMDNAIARARENEA